MCYWTMVQARFPEPLAGPRWPRFNGLSMPRRVSMSRHETSPQAAVDVEDVVLTAGTRRDQYLQFPATTEGGDDYGRSGSPGALTSINPKLDGIGPGMHADGGQLDLINMFMHGIGAWP